MKNITSIAGLKNEIQLLEENQAVQGHMLKDQFYLISESYKPHKLLGSTFKDIAASPHLIDNIVDAGVSIATGYLARRIVVGASSSIVRKLLGFALQYGAANLVAKHSHKIKSIGQTIFQNVFHKNKINSKKP